MLIRFSVTRKDTGAGVPNARIEVEKAETVGFTDNQGKAEIVTYWSGNWSYSVKATDYGAVTGTVNNRDIPVLDFGVSLLYAAKPPPPPIPGANEAGRVGTSCSILMEGTNGTYFYAIKHDRKGMLTSYHREDYADAKREADQIPACFEAPPPPPKSVDEVSQNVDTLQKMLNNTVGEIAGIGLSIAELASKLAANAADDLKGMADLESKLTDQISSTTEQELNGLLDVETRIKAWISDVILEILLNKLVKG